MFFVSGCEDPCEKTLKMYGLSAQAAEEACNDDGLPLYTEGDPVNHYMPVPNADSRFFLWDKPGTPAPDPSGGYDVYTMDYYPDGVESAYCRLMVSGQLSAFIAYYRTNTMYVNFWRWYLYNDSNQFVEQIADTYLQKNPETGSYTEWYAGVLSDLSWEDDVDGWSYSQWVMEPVFYYPTGLLATAMALFEYNDVPEDEDMNMRLWMWSTVSPEPPIYDGQNTSECLQQVIDGQL